MALLNRLERLFGRFAIENISLYLVIGQVFIFLMALLGRDLTGLIALQAGLVLNGEVWRLFSFVFQPTLLTNGSFGVMLAVFGWYMFYLMGSALEHHWGVFRYNLFLFIGWLLTVAVCFRYPGASGTVIFIGGSVFLAFAYLNPDFELLVFFILPVKIKWLALLMSLRFTYLLVVGDWALRLMVLASLANFFAFFGRDIIRRMKTGKRQMEYKARQAAARDDSREPRHRCHVCGKTDVSDPQLDFRYCSKCAGEECYCPEHLANHEHTTAVPPNR